MSAVPEGYQAVDDVGDAYASLLHAFRERQRRAKFAVPLGRVFDAQSGGVDLHGMMEDLREGLATRDGFLDRLSAPELRATLLSCVVRTEARGEAAART